MTNNSSLPVRLECGHDRWFLRNHLPEPKDDIWCPKCCRYTKAEVTPRHASIEGDWKWTPLSNGRYLVECIKTTLSGESCGYTFSTKRGWYYAESQMDKHLKRPPHGSGKFTSNLVIERIEYVEPPF